MMSLMMRLLTIMMMIMMMMTVTVIRAESREPTTSATDPHTRLVKKREAEKPTETQRVTKTESIVSVKKGESDSNPGQRGLATGDSNFELRLPSFAEQPHRRPSRPNERP